MSRRSLARVIPLTEKLRPRRQSRSSYASFGGEHGRIALIRFSIASRSFEVIGNALSLPHRDSERSVDLANLFHDAEQVESCK